MDERRERVPIAGDDSSFSKWRTETVSLNETRFDDIDDLRARFFAGVGEFSLSSLCSGAGAWLALLSGAGAKLALLSAIVTGRGFEKTSKTKLF